MSRLVQGILVVVALADCLSPIQPRRVRRALSMFSGSEDEVSLPDAAELSALFDASRSRQGGAPGDDGEEEEDDDDGDLGSLFGGLGGGLGPAPTKEVSAEDRDDFMRRIKLKELVDEEYAKVTAQVKELAAMEQRGEESDMKAVIDEMVADVEASEMKALREMEDQVEYLVGKVDTKGKEYEAAVEEVRRMSAEATAYEEQAKLFQYASTASVALLAAAAYFAATQS